MGWFGEDLFKAITRQFDRDKEKKARQAAAIRADPAVASRISTYRQKYPWLTAGAALAPAQAGLDVNDPVIERLANKAAARKAKKGQGWFSIGDRPFNPLAAKDLIAGSLDDLADIAKTTVRGALTVGISGAEALQGAVRHGVRDIEEKGPIGGGLEMFREGIFSEDVIEETTLGVAVERLRNPEQARAYDLALDPNDTSPGGAGIGQGYLPRGPATEEQARRARETMFLEYADHPIFTLPGSDAQESRQHAATLGRLTAKSLFQPGSRPFNLMSGVIDAAFTWYADPVSKVAGAAGDANQARKVFTAEEAGRTGIQVAERASVVAPRTQREAQGLAKSDSLFTSANEYLPGRGPSDIDALPAVAPGMTRVYRGGKVLPETESSIAKRKELEEMYKLFQKTNIPEAEKLAYQAKIDALSEQGRWWTIDPKYAKEFAGKGEGVYFLDVPNSIAEEALGAAKARNAKFSKIKKADEYLLPETFRGQGIPFLPGAGPADVGLLTAVRPAIHPPTTQNWLTQSAPGRKFTQWVADQKDPYAIWKTLGGEKGNVGPDLAARMADTRTTDDVLTVLGDELGVGLRTKPITSRFQPVGGYLGEVRNSIHSNRIFNAMPHNAVHLEDADESANQLVRLLRGGNLPEEKIAPLFNDIARASTTSDRGRVFMEAEVNLARHIADEVLAPSKIAPRDINYDRLRGIFEKDQAAMEEVTRRQIARKTPVEEVDIDGVATRLRSPYEDAEYFDTMYQLPDARALRRITTSYGRLLNHPVLDVPVGVLDHLSGVWKGATILRPALTLRVVGEEQVRMGAAGLDSIFHHPLSAISWAMGRKGGVDVLGSQFDAADELSAFAKSQAKTSTWRERLVTEGKQVLPFTDPNFVKAWGNDIYRFNQDDVARRLASGEDMNSIKSWLASDEAADYRTLNDIIPDATDGYVENVNNWIKGKTYGNQSLLEIIASGTFNGKPVFEVSEQGHRTLSVGFQNHLRKLVNEDVSPDHTVGDIVLPRSSKEARDLYNTVTDKAFNYLLSKPSNYLSRSPTFRQNYWKNVGDGIIHAAPDAQKAVITAAQEAGMNNAVIKSLRDISKKASGDLSLDELDIFAKSHALKAEQSLLYDLTDKNQLLDAMRLVFPFGEAWKEVLGTWAKLVTESPQIIPRAELAVRGARGSGFFYTDPQTGEEMFNYPGSQFVTKGLFDMESPLTAHAGSLNMFSNNPLLPGFGPLVQVPAGKLLPDTPDNDFIRSLVLPYGEPGSPLPSWAQKIKTAFSDPEKNVAYANTVMDVARYLESTGKYDLSTDAGKQQLEDDARSKAKWMFVFRGIAQAGLPAAPSYQDVAKDKDGHTTLAFTLTDRYRVLLSEDDKHNTNLATQRFIDEFGMHNLLYMQSASKGGEVFSKPGYDWVRENPEIVSRYPNIYGLLAPNDGGFDIKAYHALFENGTRKVLPLKEALSLANHRAAKMILRNAQSKLPPPGNRTDEQRMWLNDVKKRLVNKFPGFDAEYQGTDIPNKIAELSRAIEDPLLASQPVTGAIRAYLKARSQVEQIANSKGIIDWQTAKKLRPQRQWLRDAASAIASREPAFLTIYDDLFDHELTDEEGI